MYLGFPESSQQGKHGAAQVGPGHHRAGQVPQADLCYSQGH